MNTPARLNDWCAACGKWVASLDAHRAERHPVPPPSATTTPTVEPARGSRKAGNTSKHRGSSDQSPAPGSGEASEAAVHEHRLLKPEDAEGSGSAPDPSPATREMVVVAEEGAEVHGAGIRQAQPETLDELVEAWRHFGREIEHGTWGRMAVVARVRRLYGEGTLEEFARIVGTHPSTVCRLLKVYDSFEDGSLRRRNGDTVTFWHYVEALKAPEPEKAIEEAEAEHLSVRKLRERVEAQRPPKKAPAKREEPPPAEQPVIDSEHPALTVDVPTTPEAMAAAGAALDAAKRACGIPPAAPAPREEPKPAAPAQRVDLPEDAEDAAALVISDRGPLWSEDLAAEIRRQLAAEAA